MLKKIAVLLSIILLLLLCFFGYLKNKNSIEINVNYINFYVKNQISKISANSKVSIENTSFVWQKNNDDPYLVITNLVIKNSDFTAKIPELFIHLKLSSLFHISFSRVLADNMHVYVDKKESKTSNFNLQNSLKIVHKLFFGVSENAKIEFTNIVVNKDTEEEFHVDKLHISKKEDMNIYVHSENEKRVLNDLSITIKNRNNLLNVYGEFYNLRFSKFCTLINNNELSKDTKLKGNFSLKINQKNEILSGDMYVLSIDKDSTALNNVNLKLTYHDRVVSVKNFHFKLNDIYISLIGKMNLNTNHALFRVNISKFTTKDLCTYMPDNMVNNKLREWCCNNINGDILNTIIDFSGKINRDSLPGITVIADMENGSVKFDDDFAPVEELNGSLKLKNNNLKITVNDAKFQSFTINKGDIEMNSLDKKNSVLTIRGQATSGAYALYEAIKFKLNEIIAVKKEKVSGDAHSKFSFQVFNLNIDDKKVDFLGNFDSKIDDLTIYNGDIGKYNVELKFGRNFIDLNSGGVVNNKQLLFNLKERDNNYVCKFSGDLPAQIINMDGYVSINAKSEVNSNNIGLISGDIDLSDLILHSSYLGWKNRFEDHNNLAFSVELKNSNKLSLDITGNNLNVKLNGKVENGSLYLNSSSFTLPDNDFNLEVQLSKKKSSVMIYGEKINLSDTLELLTKDNSNSERNIEVSMDVDNVIMKDGVIIKNAKLNLTCTQGDCRGSRFTGQFLHDNSDISAEYSGIGLEVYADNAGILLRSLGISKSIKNGRMSFYLSPKRDDEKHYGMVSISNFYIKDAPLLTTLLSLSSLPGIVNAINKEGIYFHKCNVPFSYSDDIVEIEESWLEGAELGITADGNLNIQSHKFHVTGQVIPAYSINKFLSRIPMIGKLLTGGKSRGVVAIDYKANGDDKNSNVFVNLISSLTPSLLKRVLGIFDRIMTKTNRDIRSVTSTP